MTELNLLATMRAEVPMSGPSVTAQRALEEAIAAEHRRPRWASRPWTAIAVRRTISWRHNGRRRKTIAVALSLVMVAGAAGIVGLVESDGPSSVSAWSGRPLMASEAGHAVSFGTARTAVQLVDFARKAAVAVPATAPAPDEWVFLETEIAGSSAGSGGFLFGPPDERTIVVHWVKGDFSEIAVLGGSPNLKASLPTQTLIHAQLHTGPYNLTTLAGWQSVSYSYLESLPTSPSGLEAVISSHNSPDSPWYTSTPNAAVFKAIDVLLSGQTEGVVIPPKLAATLYAVLQQLPGVQFASATDLAGQTGVGFYMELDGWYKRELVIDPTTYTFMGAESVALTDHEMVGTTGTKEVTSGQVLGWYALLDESIVSQAGQLP